MRVLIIFTDSWLKFSPFILNIKTILEKDYHVRIVTGSNYRFDNSNVEGNIKYIHSPKWFLWLCRKFKVSKLQIFTRFFFYLFFQKIFCKKYDIVFGVDSVGFLLAGILYKNPVYISLEIPKDIYQRLSEKLGVKNLIILNEVRKEYLFPNDKGEINTWYIVNSPIINPKILEIDNVSDKKKKLFHMGNLNIYQYLEEYIETIRLLPDEYTLTLKGFIMEDYKKKLLNDFADMFGSGRVIMDNEYIEQDEILEHVSNYYIGFAFYNFDHVGHDNFNLKSTTSGKLLNYICAGVPVIAHDIIGFKFVEKYKCGLLLEHPDVNSLRNAIIEISDNYEEYSNNCKLALRELDFKHQFDIFFNEFKNKYGVIGKS